MTSWRSEFRRTTRILFLAAVASGSASADEWSFAGPRASGMGGASVAASDRALAAYWNPAGLAAKPAIDDYELQLSVQAADRFGLSETLRDIDKIDFNDASAANQARLQALIDRLNAPGTAITAAGTAGLYGKFNVGRHSFGINVSDVASAGAFVSTPLTVTNTGTELVVNGAVTLHGLEARQAGLSYAYAFFDGKLVAGVTAKGMQGQAYVDSAVVTSSNGSVKIFKDLKDPEKSTAFGVDTGVLWRPLKWLDVGVAGRDLNRPKFTAPAGVDDFELSPKARAGIAVRPYDSLTLAVDGDLTSNRTFVPGLRSRFISAGLEQTLFGEILALRAGAYRDVEDNESKIVPTAGLGIRIFAFRLDFAGGYDFRERAGLASFSLALTF